jgi:hypothetical protein
MIHKAHQPNVIVNFFDADGLAGKNRAEVDPFPPQDYESKACLYQPCIFFCLQQLLLCPITGRCRPVPSCCLLLSRVWAEQIRPDTRDSLSSGGPSLLFV